MTRYLTKSRFKLAVECPTKLYYADRIDLYRNLKREDTFLQALADGGFQVGKMATMLYREGLTVSARSNSEAERQTTELLTKSENITLFEPALRFENLFIRIDILVKRSNQFDLIEVKAKSYDSANPQVVGAKGEILADMLPYIQDVAFQKYVLQAAFPHCVVNSYLAMPDKAVRSAVNGLNQLFKVRRGERSVEVCVAADAQTLVDSAADILKIVPVDAYVDLVMAGGIKVGGSNRSTPLPTLVRNLADAYSSNQKIKSPLHKGCASCEFREYPGGKKRSGFHECFGDITGMTPEEVDRGTVLDIWHYRKKDQLLRQGVYRYSQLTEDDIKISDDKEGLSRTQRQWMQVRGIPKEQETDGYYLDRDLIRRHLEDWRYPLHMIDFETATVALPFFRGMRPYETIAFQYSHHIVQADGSVCHQGQFICAEPGVFPNFEFVRALKKELESDNGSIFRWAAHENTVLDHISRQLIDSESPPEDRDDLLDFISRVTKGGDRAMVDLALIAERAYFHPDTKGRVSLKRVLPAILRTSTFLRQKYQRPIYGIEIPSKNFRGFSWWEERGGGPVDPYLRLKELTQEMLGERGVDQATLDALDIDIEIAEGGAAAMAFARLQFEELTPEWRSAIRSALLRYCELDTLAMVMIFEAWSDWVRQGPAIEKS